KFGLRVFYGMDPPTLSGSGGALLNAYNNGLINRDNTALIYYGDILTTMNLRELLKQHEKSRAVATLAVSRELQLPVGVARMHGKAIIGFEEKPKVKINVGTGIMAISSGAVKVLEDLAESHNNIDIMRDLLPELLTRKMKVEGYTFDDFWLDVGSIETYEKINHEKIDELFSKVLEISKTERYV
ncbi:MAG: sugar phosphate nucleotidyltransferase, partial [Conexivisphaerales archaeon]